MEGLCSKCTFTIPRGIHIPGRCKAVEVALIKAIEYDHPNCMSALINAGADVNRIYKRRKAPLFLSASLGRGECMDLLIQAEAGVNMTADNGY